LGTLQVEVVSRNGNLTVRFQVENAAAHKAILDSLSLLQNSLGQNGAVVERIEVQQVANLSDSRQSELGREGERDSDDSPADRRQQDDEQRHKRDKPPSDDQHRQQDPEEIDIEI
jgi:flagellar hook-length control protein FliK